MIDHTRQRMLLFYSFSWATLAAFFVPIPLGQSVAQEADTPQTLEARKSALNGNDLEIRRKTAIATRTADPAVQTQLLPVFIDILKNEKDGQIRLAVLETLTDMGPAAKTSVDALVHTMRTDFGGKRNEELHQDYRSALALAAIGTPAVEGLRGLLSEKAVNVRAEAAMALGRIGPAASPAIPELILLLKADQSRVRREASHALGRMGKAALEPLLAATNDDKATVRAGSIQALGMLALKDSRAVEVALKCAKSQEAEVRAAAVRSLAAFKLPREDLCKILLENLQHDDKLVRSVVINVVVHNTELLEQIESELVNLLTSDQEEVAWHAAFLLQRRGRDSTATLVSALRQEKTRIEQIAKALALIGQPAVGELTNALDDADPRVRRGTALALGRIRPATQETVRRLAVGLNDGDREVQAAHLTSIGHLGAHARLAVPAVRLKLQDESPAIRAKAISILFGYASRDEKLMDELIAMINDNDARVQCRAIDAIRSLGPLGRRALPTVIRKLEAPDKEVQLAAAEMIGSHGLAASDAIPTLTVLLGSSDLELRLVAIQTLGQLGRAAQPAFKKLTVLIDDENSEVRASIIQTFGSLNLPPEKLRPYLAKSLQDMESDVRRQAMRAIRQFGRRGIIFIPDLITLAANDEQSGYLKRTLERYERYPIDPQSIPELIDLLEHEHEAVQLLVIKFLGLAGPAAEDAIPQLQPFDEHAKVEFRTEARNAIAKIKTAETAVSN